MSTPTGMDLFENQVLADVADVGSERLWRILWVPPGRRAVCLIELGEKDALPVWQSYTELLDGIGANELAVYESDPASARLRPDSCLSAAQREQRDRRYGIIGPLVNDPERLVLDQGFRGKLIGDLARAAGVGRNHIYSYLRLWWQLGQLPNALVPSLHLRGGPGEERAAGAAKRGRPRYGGGAEVPIGINADRDVAEKLKDGVRSLKKGMSWRQAYEKTLALHFSQQVIEDGLRRDKHLPPEELPSFDQFRYWAGKALRRGDVQRAISGEAGFARKNRPRTGTAKNLASGPGAIYQIDATVANIYLRGRLDPSRLIGRPVLYLVVDHYSRLIVGFAVGLSGPSWEVAKLALQNAFTDKVAFCNRHNIELEERQWPSRHLCRRLTGDRGWDQLGKNAGEAGASLGYAVANLPPYRPDLKGLVESRFEFLDHTDVKWAPGASRSRERGDPKHKLDGVYTADTFTEFMARCIVRYNATFAVNNPPDGYPMGDGRAPTPIDLWRFGCEACGAPQIADPDRVRKGLLHAGAARETDRGLRFRGLHYLPEDPKKFEWFVRVKGRGWRERDIRFDPRDAASIFLVLDGGAAFERCGLSEADRGYAGWTFDEVADHFARKRVAGRLAEDEKRLVDARHQAAVAELEERARSGLGGSPLVEPRAAGDRDLRAKEVREIRREGAWTSDPAVPAAPEAPAPVVAEPPPARPASAEVVPFKPSHLDLLRARRAAARATGSEE